MKRKKGTGKKKLFLVLSLIMLFLSVSIFCFSSVSAEEADITFSVGTVEVPFSSEATTVEVPVSISTPAEAVCALKIAVVYEQADGIKAVPVSITPGTMLSGGAVNTNLEYVASGEYAGRKAVFLNYFSTTGFTEGGELFKATFEIPAGSEAQTIQLPISPSDQNTKVGTRSLAFNDGRIMIEPLGPSSDVTFSVGTLEVPFSSEATTVEVPVSISTPAEAVCALKIAVVYEQADGIKAVPVSITPGTMLSGGAVNTNLEYVASGEYAGRKAVFLNYFSTTGFTEGGELFKATFEIPAGSEAQTIQLPISPSDQNTKVGTRSLAFNDGTIVITGEADECFIATAAFGSKMMPSVAVLRQFRDRYLLSSESGRAFVHYYYNISPPIASYISGSETLKVLVRIALVPLIALAVLFMNPVQAAVFIATLLFFAFYLVRRRQAGIIALRRRD